MQLLDSVTTIVVFVPFSLLALFYSFTLLRKTLQNREELDGWRGASRLGGVLLLQIGSIGIIGFSLYLIFFAGTQS